MSVTFRPKERKFSLYDTLNPTVVNSKDICVLNEATRHEHGWWSGGIVPYILNLGAGWEWVVSFIPRPLYSHGNKSLVKHRLGSWLGSRAPINGTLHEVATSQVDSRYGATD
jgi:hypothetical protein